MLYRALQCLYFRANTIQHLPIYAYLCLSMFMDIFLSRGRNVDENTVLALWTAYYMYLIPKALHSQDKL